MERVKLINGNGTDIWVRMRANTSNDKFREELEAALEFFSTLGFGCKVPEQLHQELFQHFSTILTRHIGPSSDESPGKGSMDTSVLDMNESQVQNEDDSDNVYYSLAMPYCIFSKFLEVPPEMIKIKKLLTHEFVFKMINILLYTKDTEEKSYLKCMIHRVYRNYVYLRQYIRKTIRDVFYRVAYEGEKLGSLDVLLAIYESFIRGFAMPLKNEHKAFLMLALVPLHKSPELMNFHLQLTTCIEGFMVLDCTLFKSVIYKLTRMWPLNSQKQLLFLQEVDRLVEVTNPAALNESKVQVFQLLAKGLPSSNRLVADQALTLLTRYYICDHSWDSDFEILKIIFAPLLEAALTHWNSDTKFGACKAVEVLWQRMPEQVPILYEKFVNKVCTSGADAEKREKQWQEIEASAIANMKFGIPLT